MPKRKQTSASCPYCDRTFLSRDSLVAHRKLDHCANEGVKCSICHLYFRTYSSLKRHNMATHCTTSNPIKPFRCKHCELSFFSSTSLKVHEMFNHKHNSGSKRDNVYQGFVNVDNTVSRVVTSTVCDDASPATKSKDKVKRHKKGRGKEIPGNQQLDVRLRDHSTKTDSGKEERNRSKNRRRAAVKNTSPTSTASFVVPALPRSKSKAKQRTETAPAAFTSQRLEIKQNPISELVLKPEPEPVPDPLDFSCRDEPVVIKDEPLDDSEEIITHYEEVDVSQLLSASLLSTLEPPQTELEFKCHLCPKYFSSKYTLSRHKHVVHYKPNFKKGHTRARSYSTHKGQPLSECEICHKHFVSASYLQRHMALHTTSCQCNICEKWFDSKYLFDYHMISHMGEKELEKLSEKCSVCDKMVLKHEYNRHVVTHTKPFECDLCGTSFASKTEVRHHMKSHFNVDEFPCTVCHKTFANEYSQLRHVVRRHSQAPECELCDTKFRGVYELMIHMQSEHMGELDKVASCLVANARPSSVRPRRSESVVEQSSSSSSSLFVNPHPLYYMMYENQPPIPVPADVILPLIINSSERVCEELLDRSSSTTESVNINEASLTFRSAPNFLPFVQKTTTSGIEEPLDLSCFAKSSMQ